MKNYHNLISVILVTTFVILSVINTSQAQNQPLLLAGNFIPASGNEQASALSDKGFEYADLSSAKMDLVEATANVTYVSTATSLEFLGVSPQRSEVTLSWKTEWEKNLDHFEIQKRVNENKFETIGSIKAWGSEIPILYSYTDIFPYKAESSYRLKWVDRYENAWFSEPEVVIFNGVNRAPLKITFTEDAENGIITIDLRGIPGNEFDFKILNDGDESYSEVIDLEKQKKLVLDVKSILEPGTYLMQIGNPGIKMQSELIIK